MKTRTILLSLLLSGVFQTKAQDLPCASSISIEEGRLNVSMQMNVTDFELKSCETLIITPYVVADADTIRLHPSAIYGRRNYIQYERGNFTDGIPAQYVYRAGKPASITYEESLQTKDGVKDASCGFTMLRYGCAHTTTGDPQRYDGLASWSKPEIHRLTTGEIAEMLAFIQPKAETVKTRSLSGKANVEFEVNKTRLLDNFRSNGVELAKIRAGIDSVRLDADVTINEIVIKGFASPEGSYVNNDRLALGRTQAVADYVEALYAMPKGTVREDHEAEDWSGLREWVETCDLPHRDGILAIIDDTALAPDARDNKIKKTYPAEYQTLLKEVYPSLRHTDYRIDYTVRTYKDAKEILKVIRAHPGNLSLEEFFIAAQSLEPGSPEFNEVFDIAVRMYPDDPTANLNAANAALLRRDLEAAGRYLEKAGDSPEAAKAREAMRKLKAEDEEK